MIFTVERRLEQEIDNERQKAAKRDGEHEPEIVVGRRQVPEDVVVARKRKDDSDACDMPE